MSEQDLYDDFGSQALSRWHSYHALCNVMRDIHLAVNLPLAVPRAQQAGLDSSEVSMQGFVPDHRLQHLVAYLSSTIRLRVTQLMEMTVEDRELLLCACICIHIRIFPRSHNAFNRCCATMHSPWLSTTSCIRVSMGATALPARRCVSFAREGHALHEWRVPQFACLWFCAHLLWLSLHRRVGLELMDASRERQQTY